MTFLVSVQCNKEALQLLIDLLVRKWLGKIFLDGFTSLKRPFKRDM